MPGETKLIPTGLSFQLPHGYEMQIRPRSGQSLKTKLRIANTPGTIDLNFTGQVQLIVDNIGYFPHTIEVGDKIAQGVICPVVQTEFQVVESFKETERGTKGFGSSNG